MNDLENIWVEIETNEGGVDTNGYNGQISILDYEAIYNGEYKRPFVKITNTHWYIYPDKEEEQLGENIKIRIYGEGKYSHYHGDMLIKTETIVTIQRLMHGPKDFE